MEFKDREFIPVLLGGDINTYSVARAFYEQYQVKTYIFGKFATGPSYGSKIIEYHPNPKIDTDDYFLQTVNGFAKKHKDKKIMLIGCDEQSAAERDFLQVVRKAWGRLSGNDYLRSVHGTGF